MVYAASMSQIEINAMIARFCPIEPIVAALLLLAGSMMLSGCASVGDSFASGAFVDPAKYDQFDCKQLEAERKSLSNRTAELQGLIAKAQTGTGGAVVGEMVYRNDYISARASAKQADEYFVRNKCVATEAAAPMPVVPPVTRAKR